MTNRLKVWNLNDWYVFTKSCQPPQSTKPVWICITSASNQRTLNTTSQQRLWGAMSMFLMAETQDPQSWYERWAMPSGWIKRPYRLGWHDRILTHYLKYLWINQLMKTTKSIYHMSRHVHLFDKHLLNLFTAPLMTEFYSRNLETVGTKTSAQGHKVYMKTSWTFLIYLKTMRQQE